MKRLAEYTGSNKFPGLPCVKKALEKLIKDAEEAGEYEKAEGYKERYKDLTYKDVELESLIQFPKGRILVCVVARYRGWLRYDLEVGVADMFDVINEYEIPITLVNTKDDLRGLLADKADLIPKFIYQEWNKTFGFILQNATHCTAVPDLLGGVLFSNIDYHEADYDPEELNSGSVVISDISVGIEDTMLYFKDDYKPEGPSEDEVVITREPMREGKTKVVFTLNSKIQNPTWAVEVNAPDLEVGEPVIADDKKSGYVELSLKKKTYSQGTRSIKGKVTINEVDFVFDKSFEHNPAWASQYSGSNDINDIFTLSVGFGGGVKGNTIKTVGDIDFEYTGQDNQTVKYTTPVISYYGSGSTLYIKAKAHVFTQPTSVNYIVLSDGAEPDTSNYITGSSEGLMHMPEGATGIIVTPISLKATNIEYEYDAEVTVTFNDPARTPVKNPNYNSYKILLNGEPNSRGNIKGTPEGYKLHFTQLSGVAIEELTVTCKVSCYEFIGYPSAWFEHRYGYKGEEGVFVKWDRMQYSRKRGEFKYIRADGVTDESVDIVKIGFKEGIWTSCSELNRISDSVGWYASLDMHIVQYNRPRKEFSTVTVTVGEKQYDLKTEFDYKPVDPGTWVAKHNPDNNTIVFTFTTPEGGVTPPHVIVERDYGYGDDGTMTSNWIRDKADVDDKTFTFTVNANRHVDYTYYRIWFSNTEEVTSSYYFEVRLVHADIQ